jgi:hypothetical protein
MSLAPIRRLRVALFGALALALGAAAPAFAQDAATIKRIEQMNKRAMEDYDLLEFDSARKTLVDAVGLVRSSGLEEAGHPLAARTYLNLGVVYIGGFKDKDRGRMQFVRGLKIRSDARLDANVATPELQEVFNDALKEVGKRPAKPAPPKQPDKPGDEPSGTKIEGLAHEPINEARAGFPIVVKAELGAEISAAKVILFYRGTGREDYLLVNMEKNKKGVYTGQIPADAVAGKVLQYYIEARDGRGRPLVANGSSGSPNIISVIEAAPGDGSTPDGRVGDDSEDPLKQARIKKQREEDERRQTGPTFTGRRWWLTVGFGTGFGLATGNSECAWNEGVQGDGRNYSGYCATWSGSKPTPIKTGFASAPFHIAPEFGYYLTQRFALTLQGRIQVATMADAGAANGSIAALGRALYFFGTEKLRYYVGGAAGGGYIRHRVTLGQVATNATDPAIQARDIVDTVKAGPVLFGPTAGVYYDFSKYVGLQAEINALAAAPDATFNIDVNFGINLNF